MNDTAEDNEWMTLWLPLDADQSTVTTAIAEALVTAFGRFDPDDLEIGSRTWDRGPLGNSVMCRLEVRLRGKS
jgi:hypothetical protein